ncbi:MAG: TlpA family protein disulfide reductase [Deltaproteobacteria bacterium]|nr:TlpA family protein disulfide reductase [Deltaproteobacteria bacterium]
MASNRETNNRRLSNRGTSHRALLRPIGIPGKKALAPLAVLLVAASQVLAQQPDVGEIVSRYGLRPVSPPSPAANFSLPDLSGGQGALSDYQGNWVLLTFWATWCGPCRTEMPSLEEVHRQRADSGLTVLGVSIDSDRAPVAPFVDNMGLTFPMLWDSKGQMASAYRATSIPLSYLIDPQGRIVGVSRGARNWTALLPMIDAMIATQPVDGSTPPPEPVYAQDDGPVDLPSVLDPPTAEIVLSEPHPQPGKGFFLEVQLQWAGNFEEYLPHPPEVFLPEGITPGRMTAASSSRDGSNLVTYRLALEASSPGSYALDPVELRYTPRFESVPVASRLTGPTVEVRPLRVMGAKALALTLGGGGLGAIALLALLWFRRRRAIPSGSSDDPHYENLRSRFEQARAHRLKGEGPAYATALGLLELELGPESESQGAALQQMVEQARYGGRVPPNEEMTRLERRIERRLAELRPDPRKTERQALRLRDE